MSGEDAPAFTPEEESPPAHGAAEHRHSADAERPEALQPLCAGREPSAERGRARRSDRGPALCERGAGGPSTHRASLERLGGMGVRFGDPYAGEVGEDGARPEFGWERALDLLTPGR